MSRILLQLGLFIGLSVCSSILSAQTVTKVSQPITIERIDEFDGVFDGVFSAQLSILIKTEEVVSVHFMIAPKPGAWAEPIQGTYPITQLMAVDDYLIVPIWGLYSDYRNQVTLTFTLKDGSTHQTIYPIETQPYVDPLGTYDKVVTMYRGSLRPSFSYFLVKQSRLALPVIFDVDGNVRWAVHTIEVEGLSSLFYDNMIYTHMNEHLLNIHLDGQLTQTTIAPHPDYEKYKNHHNLEVGKKGLFAEVTVTRKADQVRLLASVLFEVLPKTGEIIQTWDLGDILKKAMIEHDEDPELLVRDGEDWCHMNSAIYDRERDSVVISCRETFIISIDYSTHQIEWIFGDPTKKWYQSPTLAALALTTESLYPIGQHALTIEGDQLTFFNNGLASRHHTPAGEHLEQSQASQYQLDLEKREAHQRWFYQDGRYGSICSSVYQDRNKTPNNDYLITYSHDIHITDRYAYILGVRALPRTEDRLDTDSDSDLTFQNEVLFEYRIPNYSQLFKVRTCTGAHNATILNELTQVVYEEM